ncbi:MAG: Holliday junction branch migration DNA helicase RuvB [Trichococcus flocculiformis]|jgi:holliday junction DNA helicase RuvB|nr:Holliday junction branch migration DNA helicase RuvB [Trichococcus sp.]HQZ19869.1 Holliday junction branch migration DNA helicase RuvB [Trichococcus flocculiformis]MBP6246328.1 Holliday junction branch migration DNA helicase RuvB [Trichococcus sp.]MBP7127887.1 Holliday junction branch migration DNA helicase RuvB [Trichococcus sp.]MBP8682296.1 Holliday junction branch migration DNA helicase RuvB [Trichococcus sp.]
MTAENRIVSGNTEDLTEDLIEKTLRPQMMAHYIGQDKVKNELKVYIQAAKARSEALDHVLLYGPPGLGKTTLAMVISNELDVRIHSTSGPAIERPGDLMVLLNELEAGDVLFIDEIHRLPRIVEEVLYSAMEDYYVDIIIGQGPTAHPVHFTLPPFTLVGATTKAGSLSAPLRDRFGIVSRMEYYSLEDLRQIVHRSSDVLSTKIDESGAVEIALRSRGTPRVANRLLRRVRDFAQVYRDGLITKEIADKALSILSVDNKGLDDLDRQILTTMIRFYNGGPVGLSTIAANIGEEMETIEDMYEPYLLQLGFLQRTPRGRVATPMAYDHLGISYDTEK